MSADEKKTEPVSEDAEAVSTFVAALEGGEEAPLPPSGEKGWGTNGHKEKKAATEAASFPPSGEKGWGSGNGQNHKP